MSSQDLSNQSGKQSSSRRSLSSWLQSCFSQNSVSESESDSENDYVLVNHSLFKVPRTIGPVTDNIYMYHTKEDRTMVVQRGSTKGNERLRRRRSSSSVKKVTKTDDKRGTPSTSRRYTEQEERIYQYIRMKTYEKMNPYEMPPNEFLNNLSSVFVDNLKDPVPKDPKFRPKIYNNYLKGKKRGGKQMIQYEKAKTSEQTSFSGLSDPSTATKPGRRIEASTLLRPSIHVASDLYPRVDEPGFKAAIEREEKPRDIEEKVLIWKIVLTNEDDDTRDDS